MNKGVAAVLALIAAAIAGPAAAQSADPSGIYLGGSIGLSQYKDSCKELTIPCEDQDTAFRFFGGYQFNRNWGLELGFGDFGEMEANGTIPAGGNGQRKIHSYAFDLTGLGSFYLSQRLSLFGRLGMYMGRTTVDRQFANFPDSNTHDANTNSGFTYGAGAAYTLGRFGLRAEWQRYDNIGTNNIAGSDGTDEVDVFSLAFLFRFF